MAQKMSQVECFCFPLAWTVLHSVFQIGLKEIQREATLFFDTHFLYILSKCVLGMLKNVVLNIGIYCLKLVDMFFSVIEPGVSILVVFTIVSHTLILGQSVAQTRLNIY